MDIYKCPNSIFKKESLQKKILKNLLFFYEVIVKLLITHSLGYIRKKHMTA